MYLNNDDDGGGMTYRLVNKPAKEYWTVDNPSNKYARIEAQGPEGARGARRLYNRSFVRLENISIGYTLPRQWTKRVDIERSIPLLRYMPQFGMLLYGALRTGNIMVTRKQAIMLLVFGHWDLT